jgi:predicted CXXCH cytochrome family protein
MGNTRTFELKKLAVSALVALAVVALPATALAFSDPSFESPFTCDQCHSTSSASSADWEGNGPHGLYSATTQKCGVCHSVHEAPADGILLLAEATVSGTCLSCHDGTGGTAPYNAIEARGGVVLSDHSIDTTSVVPGGSQELSSVLGCSDCHSVHGTGVVAPFYRDSGVALGAQVLTQSDSLLRSDVNTTAAGAFPVYGSQWCAACHDDRHSQSGGAINHPVNTSYTFGYGEITTTEGLLPGNPPRAYGDGSDGTYIVGMGMTNAGYIMAPATASADGRVENRQDPICQQCHEDARDVDTTFNADYSDPNPIAAGYNPLYLTFPHQSTNRRLLVETNDDLCMNCHALAALP